VEGVGLMRDFWVGRRVLLTGHTGFKGSWLGLWLMKLGARVTGVSLKPEGTPNLFSELDLEHLIDLHYISDICKHQRLPEIVKECQPDVVFHLAAQPLVLQSYKEPLNTWATNVLGSLHLLEALKPLQHTCAVVMITTDKVYENKEWINGYRESDRLGGHDPYSASKAAAELAIASWRDSFCGLESHQSPHLAVATARAGNVIGGGDWSADRIVPDIMRGLTKGRPILVRNPHATRPWQHVLDPLAGYLSLAKALYETHNNRTKHNPYAGAFNFGPQIEANRSVGHLIESVLSLWPGTWKDLSGSSAVHEASRLHLQIDKAYHLLRWQPRWPFAVTVERTVRWFRAFDSGVSASDCCINDIQEFDNRPNEIVSISPE
jgi:CDP-glucose 4,6-dehydratase